MIQVISIHCSISAFILVRNLVLYKDERESLISVFNDNNLIFVPFVLFALIFTAIVWPWILYRSLIGKSVLRGDP